MTMKESGRYLCGHEDRTPGCGGCDPGAIEVVITDQGQVHAYDPAIHMAGPEQAAQVQTETQAEGVETGCLAGCDPTGTKAGYDYQCPVCGFGSVPSDYVPPQIMGFIGKVSSALLAAERKIGRLAAAAPLDADGVPSEVLVVEEVRRILERSFAACQINDQPNQTLPIKVVYLWDAEGQCWEIGADVLANSEGEVIG